VPTICAICAYAADENNFLQDFTGWTREDIIRFYFNNGHTVCEIIGFLLIRHQIVLSIRQLQRIMRRLKLRRYSCASDIRDVVKTILNVRRLGVVDYGYRAMWRFLNTTCGMCVTQKTTLEIMRLIDPEGIRLRGIHRLRRRMYTNNGPNFLVHVDGNDKLKPFGISIHGAIDGFSRRIIWLKAGFTNSDPRYIAGLYMDHVLNTMSVPRQVRHDAGTENGILVDLHIALRSSHQDSIEGLPVHLSGRSTANQRIEMFWGILNRAVIFYWRSLFRDMRDEGILCNADPIHLECVRFCFMRVIQDSLDMFRTTWNGHRIRRQRNTESLSGKPNVLYFQPQLYHAHDYARSVLYHREDVRQVASVHTLRYPELGCSGEFVQIMAIISGFNPDELVQPRTRQQALELFAAVINALPEP
jgi:hypothetical protein